VTKKKKCFVLRVVDGGLKVDTSALPSWTGAEANVHTVVVFFGYPAMTLLTNTVACAW